MKKIMSLALAAVLCLGLLAGCGAAGEPENTLTGADLAEHYKSAIEAGRTESDNADRPINVTGEEEEMGSYFWELLGFAPEDVDAFAVSLSLMNVQAYCVGLFKPVEGKAETVTSALETYITGIQASFENYLPDQGAIADAAILETLDDGSILLVMCEGQDSVRDAIVAAL